MPETKKVKAKQYKVLVGMNYTPEGKDEEVRREVGDVISDLPSTTCAQLREQGYLEEVN
jgi:hypothetical protein